MRAIALLLGLLCAAPAWAAFPTVTDWVATTDQSGTTHTVTRSSCAAGNLEIIAVSSSVATFPMGWTTLGTPTVSSGAQLGIYYRWMDGTETSTISVTLSVGGNHIYHAVCVSGASDPAAVAPATTTFVGSGATGTTAPDPPNLAAPWGSADNLWCTWAAYDEDTTPDVSVSAYPSNYSLYQHDSATAGVVRGLGMACREVAASSENPGAYTLSSAEQWVAATIAIRPAENCLICVLRHRE